ncbi:MAG: hypothetical protein NT031_10870, partial [Planctomycetota bacterium]|nr:hypothetical protein [Planctomycetota bacterium]
NLDDSAVVKELRNLGMHELLEGLAAEDARSDDAGKLAAAVDATLALAAGLTDPEARKKVLDTAVRLIDKLLPLAQAHAAQPDAPVLTRIEPLRLRLRRAVARGVTQAEPYANQILYLLADDADRWKVLACRREALASLPALANDIATEEALQQNGVRPVGRSRRLAALTAEARYNQAWMLLYAGIATPTDAEGLKARAQILGDAILLASEWLPPAPDEIRRGGGVSLKIRQDAILIAGIASRELKQNDKAREYLEQLLDDPAPPTLRARALFELARMVVEEGRLAPGLAAIKGFRDKAAGKGLKTADVEAQATLLTSHLYDILAAAASPTTAPAK